ncbi:MAG: DUF3795 domain-containing protein [Clostridiales bacterium]|nr:DUF3795 domain-containing protein [Clostridiales bacterium]
MWSEDCEIFKCCKNHNVSFCGLCDVFPCQWLISKLGEWNPEGIENLRNLKEEYLKWYPTQKIENGIEDLYLMLVWWMLFV